MRMHSLRLWLAVAFVVGAAHPGVTQSGNPAQLRPSRIVTGIRSPAQLLEELQWLIGEVAGEQKTWNEKLIPAFEVFLIGVDSKRPLGVDFVFDRTNGSRSQWQVPLESLNDFRAENLEPIDIQSRRVGSDRTLYQLTSTTLDYKGWMRIVDNYASISTVKEDVPADMPSPRKALDELLNPKGYSAGLYTRNDADGMSDRREAFAKIRENMLASVTRRPTETREAFELRQAVVRHQALRLERLFVETESLTAGWITDRTRRESRGELTLTALAGTELAGVVSLLGANPSYFAAVPTTDNAVVTGRLNFPVDDRLQLQVDEFFRLAGPVWKQRIDGDKSLTAAQKTARKQVVDLLFEMIQEGGTLRVLEACIEITPTADGLHQLLCGIRTADGTKAIEILKLIPQAVEGFALETNVDAVDDVAFHRLKFTEQVPESLKSFYGESGDAYIATYKEAVWIAGGADALERLKATIALVRSTPGEPTGEVLIGKARLGIILTHLDHLAVETGFDLDQFLGRDPAAAPEDNDKTRRGGALLTGIDWRGIALPTLRKSEEDRLTIEVRQHQGVLSAHTHVQVGILQAAGKVIAKVATDKLGEQ